MPKRDPYQVLGVSHDASQTTIKAAWRRLAREHHPDLVGDDASAARRATREMAEINAAYQDIRDPERRQAWRDTAASHTATPTATTRPRSHPGGGFEQAARASGPPRPRERPITARLDTTELFRPRNQTLDPRPASPLPGWEPRPRQAFQREAPRASDPTGPSQRRRGRVIRPVLPPLEDAILLELRFGKFHGHTLGDVANFEPSYIDWIVRTLADPELVGAARVVQEAMDRAGVGRRRRPGAPSEVGRGGSSQRADGRATA